jgi:DNA polymerase III delta prime subunit
MNPSALINMLFSNPFMKKAGGPVMGGVAVAVCFLIWRVWRRFGIRYGLLFLGGIIAAILVILGIYLIWKYYQKRRGEKLEGDLALRVREAVGDLREKWTEALAVLRKQKISLYKIPWVLIIGEPGSGKTTTLRESGLKFTLEDVSLKGSGGTVNCDWWFAQEAVILDTAGRWSMPVETAPDRGEWRAFLGMLSKYRQRCPINSVIVTIPATSLLEDSEEEIGKKAQNIRERLLELADLLHVEYPIYVMVSKLDLVYGFAEFCSELAPDERSQILGWDRPELGAGPYSAEEFRSQLKTQAARLEQWSLRWLKKARPGNKADKIYAFPGQFQRLETGLNLYLSSIFRKDIYNPPLMWRGVYFSSALQEGRALLNAFARGSGKMRGPGYGKLDPSIVVKRAYFIRYFYEKIFIEHGLVRLSGISAAAERKFRLASIVIGSLLFLGGSMLLINGHRSLSKILEPMESRVRVAGTYLKVKDPATPQSGAEIADIAEVLKESREKLSNDKIAGRFLRGRENSIVQDIGVVEDALVMRCLFKPFLSMANEDMAKYELPTAKEKNALRDAMAAYLEISGGKDTKEKRPGPLLNVLSGGSKAWMNVPLEDLERLWKVYPRKLDFKTVAPSEDKDNLITHRALTQFRDWWETMTLGKWERVKTSAMNTSRTYQNYLEAAEPEGENAQAELEAKKEFLAAAAEDYTQAVGSGVFPKEGKAGEECVADYEKLKLAAAVGERGPHVLAPAVNRHSSVCAESVTKINGELQTFVRDYGHLIKADGTVNPEIEEVLKAISLGGEYGPLFTATEEGILAKDPLKAGDLVTAWSRKWVQGAEEKKAGITGALAQIAAPGWDKQRLENALARQVDNAVWLAEKKAVETALSHMMSGYEAPAGPLQPGGTPPETARAGWLAARSGMIETLTGHLRNRYPARPEPAETAASAKEAMAGAYKGLLEYWRSTLAQANPCQDILATQTWKAFYSGVSAKQGVFVDTAGWPLGPFLASVKQDDLDAVRKVLGDSQELGNLEREVRRALKVFGSSQYTAQIGQAQNLMFSAMQNLGGSAESFCGNFDKAAGGGQGIKAGFQALAGLKRALSADTEVADEPITGRLSQVGEHGLNLLMTEVRSICDRGDNDCDEDCQRKSREFTKAFPGFRNTWQGRTDGVYPFAVGRCVSDQGIGRVGISCKTVDAGVLREFLTNEQNGLPALLAKIGGAGALAGGPVAKKLTVPQKEFLSACVAWKNFLFDVGGNARTHRLAMEIVSGEVDKGGEALFTEMRIEGISADKENDPFKLRFSGKHGEGTVDWKPSGKSARFEAHNDVRRLVSEVLLTGGELAFFAYMAFSGAKEQGLGGSRFAFEMRMANPLETRSEVQVPVRFVVGFDEEPPGPISWP